MAPIFKELFQMGLYGTITSHVLFLHFALVGFLNHGRSYRHVNMLINGNYNYLKSE